VLYPSLATIRVDGNIILQLPTTQKAFPQFQPLGYVSKFSMTGVHQWTKPIDEQTIINNITCDNSGNVYVTRFDKVNGGAYCVKYSSAGVYQWSRSLQSGSTKARGVACDTVGNVYFLATLNPSLAFIQNDDTRQRILEIPYMTLQYGYLMKFDSSGNLQWSQIIDAIEGKLACDMNNNIYISGTNRGTRCCFMKFNSSGILQWNRGNYFTSYGTDVTFDSSGNVYFSGVYRTSPSAEDLTIPRRYLSTAFFEKYDTNGVYQWSRIIAGNDNNVHSSFGQTYLINTQTWSQGISCDGNGLIHVIGTYVSARMSTTAPLVAEYDIITISRQKVGSFKRIVENDGSNSTRTMISTFKTDGTYLYTKFIDKVGNSNGITSDSYGNTYIYAGIQGLSDANLINESGEILKQIFLPKTNIRSFNFAMKL
jgi:hypothetical protein